MVVQEYSEEGKVEDVVLEYSFCRAVIKYDLYLGLGCSVLGRGAEPPPILGVVNMVGTRNFTCYMGAL